MYIEIHWHWETLIKVILLPKTQHCYRSQNQISRSQRRTNNYLHLGQISFCSITITILIHNTKTGTSLYSSKAYKTMTNWLQLSLKALYIFGNCQRPVFSVGESQLSIAVKNLLLKLHENNEKQNKFVCFLMPQKASGQKSFNIRVRNYLFLKNYVTSEGAVSHNVVYYQQLSPLTVTKLVFRLTIILR